MDKVLPTRRVLQMDARRRHHLVSWRQPTVTAGTLIPGALPTIITMGHLSSKNAQAARKKKARKGIVVSTWRRL
jgi:hypothetical protein